MSVLPTGPEHPAYDGPEDRRTKQAFKDQCDVNQILKKAQRTGALSHLEQFGGQYGDFAGLDFQTMMNQIAEASSIFERLPSEIRREFDGDPGKFFAFANRPENVNRLGELLPAIAEPGNYFPRVNAGQRAPSAPEPAKPASSTTSEAPAEPPPSEATPAPE